MRGRGQTAGIEPLSLERSAAIRRFSSCIPDPPPVLWSRGDLDSSRPPRRGHRRIASRHAVRARRRLPACGQELSDREIVVTSGLARGVDSAAHRGCLSGCEPTVAVLGSRPRPHVPGAAHRAGLGNIAERLADQRVGARRGAACPSTFRCGTVLSPGSRWRLWSSKRPRRAGPSLQPDAPSSRVGT